MSIATSPNLKYFYKLGHCPALAIAEISNLSQEVEINQDSDFALSNELIDIQKTGSLIFQGKIHKILETENMDQSSIFDGLKDVFSSSKVGLSIFTKREIRDKTALQGLKNQGYKKINLLNDKLPSIGNFLHTKNWFIIFSFKNKLILGEIQNHFNQEFWSDLDMTLPIRDLKRGQINLKLARSLANLTTSTTFWDPFCGIARNIIPALDLKEGFVASDIDKIAIPQAKQNYKFATKFFTERGFEVKDKKIEFFNKDITKSFAKLNLDLPKTVVTEGYLGKTFKRPPTENEINIELQNIEKLWNNALANFKELEIQEIIFCLPFYIHNKKLILPEFIHKIAKENGYQEIFFSKDQNKILYKRASSQTGHWVLKMVKESL